jgi:hypothetical protein
MQRDVMVPEREFHAMLNIEQYACYCVVKSLSLTVLLALLQAQKQTHTPITEMDAATTLAISLDDVKRAAERIAPYVKRTPASGCA